MSRTQTEEASARKVKMRQQCGKVCEYSHLAAAAHVGDRGPVGRQQPKQNRNGAKT